MSHVGTSASSPDDALANSPVKSDQYGALEAARSQMKSDPDNPHCLRELITAALKLGDVHRERQSLANALACYEEGLEACERLVALDKKRVENQTSLNLIQTRIGDMKQALGDAPGALVAFNAALSLFEKMANFAPSRHTHQRNLMQCHRKLSDVDPINSDRHLAEALRLAMDLDRAGQLRLADQVLIGQMRKKLVKGHASGGLWTNLKRVLNWT
ncbi:tetratricopeptide repeat protein [uncultured Cohaesibacter sp.]|uniref:tetratricopeptide repeat protein n=1 Tax=uncultured Cohaesibacter sp. TaxID=1002546 RepID=UPI00292F0817|nr:tetratricopeptide repeat protein [uncultured Cohaesibacter sp.]